ncbi:MAG: putative transposase [Candidatus Petromonas sp.]|jgi:hypothetical protein|nr:putative transposase [Candidatus Petromonas sp.]
MYKKYPEEFYVYGKGEVQSAKGTVKYVGRYTGRPAIAGGADPLEYERCKGK